MLFGYLWHKKHFSHLVFAPTDDLKYEKKKSFFLLTCHHKTSKQLWKWSPAEKKLKNNYQETLFFLNLFSPFIKEVGTFSILVFVFLDLLVPKLLWLLRLDDIKRPWPLCVIWTFLLVVFDFVGYPVAVCFSMIIINTASLT